MPLLGSNREDGGGDGTFICDANVTFAGEGVSKERHPLVGVNVEKLAPIPLGCALGCGRSSIEPFRCWYEKQTDQIKAVILGDEAGAKEGTGEVIILGYAITVLSACGLLFITAGITVWARSRLKNRTIGPPSPIDTLTLPHSRSQHSRNRHGTATTGPLGMGGTGTNTATGRPRFMRPLDQVGTTRGYSPHAHHPHLNSHVGAVSAHHGHPPRPQPPPLSPVPNPNPDRAYGPYTTSSAALPLPPWSEPRMVAVDEDEEEEEARSCHTMSSRASQSDLLV